MTEIDKINAIQDIYKDLNNNNKIITIANMINMLNERLSWDQYFMLIALTAKSRSSCDRLHVGCVITRNNRVLCTGYNGHIPGAPHKSIIVDNHEQMTIHAEVNAICHAADEGIKLHNSKAYITHFPCINCTKNLIASGISEVVYLEDYKNNPICMDLFMSKGVKVNKITL